MPHIRRRTTKAGSVSTAHVESYRDEMGRPRQRLLANLHGEPDMVSALAKLEFQRDALRKHRDEQRAEEPLPNGGDDEIAVEYFAKIDDDLAAMENEISIIKKHCSAAPDEIQAAIAAHKIALDDALAMATGSFMYACRHANAHKTYKAKLRRMRS
jgi:hypothetical protein